MSDRNELRRLAEVAPPGPWKAVGDPPAWISGEQGDVMLYHHLSYIAAVDPQTVRALLDAADRGDRAVELLREFRDSSVWRDQRDALLAEVDD